MPVKPRLARELPEHLAAPLAEKLKDLRLNYNDIAEWLTGAGHPATPAQVRAYAMHARLRERKYLAELKVDKLLTPGHSEEYESFLADRRHTLDDAEAWLKERGYTVSRRATDEHRRRFRLAVNSMRDSARLATAMTGEAAKGPEGRLTFTDGMMIRSEQVLMEQLVNINEKQEVEPERLKNLSGCVASAVAARERYETVRAQFEARNREALRAGQQLAKAGATGKDVVARMQEIMGV
jgi:hypothetical protein